MPFAFWGVTFQTAKPRHMLRVMCIFLLLIAATKLQAQVGKRISDSDAETFTNRATLNRATVSVQGAHWQPAEPINFDHPAFFEAPVVHSNPRTHSLEVELTVAYSHRSFTTFRGGQQVTEQLHLRSYNGQPVGPTLVARPGDTLNIRLVNQLPPEQHPPHCEHHGAQLRPQHCEHNIPHHFNTTNLHTHGLHVDPTGRSDNTAILLASGEHFDYQIRIPDDHPAGTFWYHAHVHGATTVQVGSGVAGALIVKGDYDSQPALDRAQQRVMLLQEIAFDSDGRIEDNQTYAPTAWSDQAAARGWHLSVNGQVMPELRLRPGEMQVWRLIHAGVRKLTNLQLQPACWPQHPVPLIQLAADGIPFDSKRLSDDHGLFLAPGSRGDVAVRAFVPGVYYLVDTTEQASSGPLPAHYCDYRRGDKPLQLDGYAQGIIARVVVSGMPHPMRYPRNRELARLTRPASISDHELSPVAQHVAFDIDLSRDPWIGLINGQPFDPERPRVLKLGEAQVWYLSSHFSHHPFHIHVNPFEVIERDAQGNIIDRYWKDTLNVPQTDPNDVYGTSREVRMRYADFTGAFVAHCHILDHGDRGMMEMIVIEP